MVIESKERQNIKYPLHMCTATFRILTCLPRAMPFCEALPFWMNYHNFCNYSNLVHKTKVTGFSRFFLDLLYPKSCSVEKKFIN